MASPKVSFVLVCYRQEKFIQSAVRAALAQDYEPLEIVISDDGSPDGTFDIVERETSGYDGPHAVRLNRNATNLGSIEHHNKVMSLAQGDFVVFAHGDDISSSHRTRRLVETWRERNVSMVSSNAEIVDIDGKRIAPASDIDVDRDVTAEQIVDQGWQTSMLGSTLSCHRDVFSKFARLDPMNLFVGLDHVLPFRASLLDGLYYLSEPLVHWRKHDTNMTNTIFDRTGGDLVLRETRAAFSATNRICMLDDLVKLMKDRPDDPRFGELAHKLRGSNLSFLRRWTRYRNRLMLEGLRPTWVEKAALDAAPIEQDWNVVPARSGTGSPESGSDKS